MQPVMGIPQSIILALSKSHMGVGFSNTGIRVTCWNKHLSDHHTCLGWSKSGLGANCGTVTCFVYLNTKTKCATVALVGYFHGGQFTRRVVVASYEGKDFFLPYL